MSKNLVYLTLWALVAALLPASDADAAQLSSRLLSPNGDLIQVVQITEPEPRLALSTPAGQLLVPGTDNLALEVPLGIVDSRAGGIQALWTSRVNGRTILEFATLRDGQWDGPHSLMAGINPARIHGTPFVSLQEDALTAEFGGPEGSLFVERQIVHVAWRDDESRIRYSPLTFRNGVFVGWNEVVTLSSAFAHAHRTVPGTDLHASLAGLLSVRSEDGKMLVTLTDSDLGRIGTMEIFGVPLAAELLADSIHDHVFESAELYDPEDLSPVADAMRAHIVHVGSRLDFDPTVGEFLSDRMDRWVREAGSGYGWDLAAFAEASRSATLDLTQSVYQVTVPNASGEGMVTLLDLGDFLDDGGHRDDLANLVRLRLASDFASPQSVGATGIGVHVSADGDAMAVSWKETDGYRWTLNRGDGWSETRLLPHGAGLDPGSVRKLIETSLR